MKVIVCDSCKEQGKPIFFDEKNEQLCETCYYNSDHYEMDELEEDWGIDMAKKLKKFDGFLVIGYEDFNYPEESAKEFAGKMSELFKKLGITNIKVDHDSDDENSIIGFRKI